MRGFGDLVAGGFDGLAGLLAEAVGAGGVGVDVGQQGEHRLDDAGIGLGGGVVVEVDHCWIISSISEPRPLGSDPLVGL